MEGETEVWETMLCLGPHGSGQVWETMLCLGPHGSGLSYPNGGEGKGVTDTTGVGAILGRGTDPLSRVQRKLGVQS